MEISTVGPSQAERLVRETTAEGSVCNSENPRSMPPPRPTIPVCFVWQQLSRCKNPTLFLITQSADSIKLSLRRLHCFLSAHNNWQTPRALTASMEWSLEFWSCQIFKRRYAYMYVFTLHLFIAKDVLSLSLMFLLTWVWSLTSKISLCCYLLVPPAYSSCVCACMRLCQWPEVKLFHRWQPYPL